MGSLDFQPNSSPSSWCSSEDGQFPAHEGVRWRILSRPMLWRPQTDVYETEDTLVIRVEIAGMREEDFSISLGEGVVTIRGTRSDTPERRAYFQMEIPYGEFSVEVELPIPVDQEKVEAVYQDGFLRMTFNKEQPHQIKARLEGS